MPMQQTEYDVIVVGGGASGLMAAGRAAGRGLRVLLLEKNARLGEKLRISGGGRCNITNAEEHLPMFITAYGAMARPLYTLFAQFGVKETRDFFEEHQLPLMVEAHKRVFPQSENAEDVVRVLEKYMQQGRVEVRMNTAVTRVECADNSIGAVWSGEQSYRATEYIFATGGTSHPETGSTGDGFLWLSAIGHTSIKPTPSVVPLSVREIWAKSLSGVALSDMKITFYVDRIKQFSLKGRVLFTHFGLSGPLILNSANRVADLLHEGVVTAHIDAYPTTDLGTLERQIIKVFDVNKNKVLKSVIKDIVPEGMAVGVALLIAEVVDLEMKVHSVTKENRRYISTLLKALPLTITGLMGLNRAVVVDGGVPLEEVDLRTMRSKKIRNLFITGDLLHINRPSGGYSLQLCWSTGFVAGSNIGKEKSDN